jgi:hypothetical protein
MAGGAHDAHVCAVGSRDGSKGDAPNGAADAVRLRVNQWEQMAAGAFRLA